MDQLKVLALVSRLTGEISNYTGLNDKSIAEFVIDVHSKCESLEPFKLELHEAGADFPDSLVETLDRIIRQLHPKYRKAPVQKAVVESASQSVDIKPQYKGLSIPDTKPIPLATRNNRRIDRKPTDGHLDHHPHKRTRDRLSPETLRPSKPLVQDVTVGSVYDARVHRIMNYGAFAEIQGIKRRRDGERLNHPSDRLDSNQMVKVKVLADEDGKLRLSMLDIDQNTGKEISRSPRQSHSNVRARKRLTSPERWELRQLAASGAIKVSDYPELQDVGDVDEETTDDPFQMKVAEEVEIEVSQEEPPFLEGQTKHTLDLSPIRVVKAPDGSLNRAAMSGAIIARDRREAKLQEAREKEVQLKKELKVHATNSHDPMQSQLSKHDRESRTKEEPVQDTFASYWRQSSQNYRSYGRRTDQSIEQQRKTLPVYRLRRQLIEAVKANQILVVVGDTGSGKTTQITQYLAEEGFVANGKRIGCTQPRRVAAVSVAKRVAQEFGCRLGTKVGYTIRFEDCSGPDTMIKYMTDGMLQRETLLDPDVSQYSVIMLDEAHERTIATDVLFALLKKAAQRRPELRLIITSATLDAQKFSRYFFDCPILHIPGRTFPVDIMYTKDPEFDYLDAALMTVMQIHLGEPPGDILVFLTGQEEIDTSCEILYKRVRELGPDAPELVILPVYSSLPSEMQSRIFDPAPPGGRKVVIATNIAETSITIDGIYYVVDPGFVKINAYDPKLGMDSLVISPISQAQANQRAGRAGRTGPGKCYRLYTETAFKTEMMPNTVPEIQRQNLAHTILMLKAMGINDLLHFDFMDLPPTKTMLMALEELYSLAALDDEGLLTSLGRKMADFPMDPSLAKVLIASVDAQCSEEMLTIVAMLSVPSIFYRPKDKQDEADQRKARFNDYTGDHLTLLNIYNSWTHSNQSKSWCMDNFIQERSLKRASEVRTQLATIMRRHDHAIVSCGGRTDTVRKCLCAGFFRNAAKRDPTEGFKSLIEGTTVFMHPSSALFGKQAHFVIYHTLLLTSKEYMHCVTSVEPKWLLDAAPTFFKRADDAQISKKRRAEKIEPLYNRFANDKNEWRLSTLKKPPRDLEGTFGGGAA